MKKSIKTTLLILTTASGFVVSSCQEETIQPAHEVRPPRDASSGLATGR